MKFSQIFIVLVTGMILYSCSDRNQTADSYGNFEAKEIIISSESTGTIEEFNAEEGQLLKMGQYLGYIDTSQLILKQNQIIAQRRSVVSRLDNVRAEIGVMEEERNNLLREKDRLENLLKDGAATTKQMDDLNGTLNVLVSRRLAVRTQLGNINTELKVADTQLEQLRDQVEKSVIESPLDGTVLEKYVEVHELAVPGKSLFKMADLSTMFLRAYISGHQLAHVKIGQQVKVYIDKDEKENIEYDGIITWISSQAEFTPKIIQTKEERVNLVYSIKVAVENDGRLKIGMPGEIIFE
jgi:HlyD family secretion protein